MAAKRRGRRRARSDDPNKLGRNGGIEGAALPSSTAAAAGPKPDVITLSSSSDIIINLSSSDEAPRVTSGAAGSKPDIINLSSSSDGKQEASSWKGSSSAASKDAPLVFTSSDSDSDGQLLAKRRKRRPPCYVAWVFADEVDILTALADERLKSGGLPRSPSALLDAIRSRAHLKRQNLTAGDVAKKVHNLKDKFERMIASGGRGGGQRDETLYELSAKVWPELLPRIEHDSSSSSSSSD